jgi:hypothetical protein
MRGEAGSPLRSASTAACLPLSAASWLVGFCRGYSPEMDWTLFRCTLAEGNRLDDRRRRGRPLMHQWKSHGGQACTRLSRSCSGSSSQPADCQCFPPQNVIGGTRQPGTRHCGQ